MYILINNERQAMNSPMTLSFWLAQTLQLDEEDIRVDGPQTDLRGYEHAMRVGNQVSGVPYTHNDVVVDLKNLLHAGDGMWIVTKTGEFVSGTEYSVPDCMVEDESWVLS